MPPDSTCIEVADYRFLLRREKLYILSIARYLSMFLSASSRKKAWEPGLVRRTV
jgi:hypothetical protein